MQHTLESIPSPTPMSNQRYKGQVRKQRPVMCGHAKPWGNLWGRNA